MILESEEKTGGSSKGCYVRAGGCKHFPDLKVPRLLPIIECE
jgi:hypothetical protein